MTNRGFSLIELTFAIGLGLTVMAVGYRAHVGVQRMHDIESRRESMTLNVQNTMAKIKRDVRSASTVAPTGDSLVIDSGRITYRSTPRGVERTTSDGRGTTQGVKARFKTGSGGVSGADVTLRAEDTVRRRPIRIEVTSFISPRNR